MSTISDAVDAAVGDITATARTAAQDVADSVTAFYSTELTELQAVATTAQTKVEQLTSALAAATAAETADQAQVDALTEQLATANSQLAQVQADFAEYKKSHPDGPPPPPPAGRFPGDPGVGRILWGQTKQGGVAAIPARAAQYAAILGETKPRYPWAVRRYITPDQSTVAGAKAAAADAVTIQGWGAYPFIDVKEPPTSKDPASNVTLADIAAGKMDPTITALMQGLVASGKPSGVGYHQEIVGDSPGGTLATPDGYAKAIQRFKDIRDSVGGKNLITVTGCLGIGSFTGYGGSKGLPQPWIDALAPVVDVWGTHRYLQATDSDPASAWKTVEQVFGPFWDLLDKVDPKRAKFHGEWSVHTRKSDLTFAPKWMDHFLAYGVSRGLAVACIFDSALNSPNAWTLDFGGETSRLQAFARELVNPICGPA